jgi:glycosyltransferase involved in cell wall biosynthesis
MPENQSKFPRISIVMPSFNQGEYIEASILSVIDQHYPNLQFIVIDGGSTDTTLDILEKYKSKIDKIISEKDNGQSDAINKGLLYVDGILFNWLNSDDLLTENSLFTLSEMFLNYKADVIIGKTEAFDVYGKNILNRTSKLFSPAFALTSLMSQQSTFYNTEMIKKLGGVNNSLHYCMDWELWIRFTATFGMEKIVYSDAILGKFRLHPSSKTAISLPKFDIDKTAVALEILKSIDSKSYLKLKTYSEASLYKKEWKTNIEDNSKYKALAIEVILDRNSKLIPLDVFINYFFKSLTLQYWNRWRFIALPLRLLLRKLF